MKKLKLVQAVLLLTLAVNTLLPSCKKNKTEETPATTTTPVTTTPAAAAKKAGTLVIDNGATSVNVDGNITYSATLVKTDGTFTVLTSGVTWSVSSTSVGSFSGGIFTPIAVGLSTIQASYTLDGITYTAAAPIVITAAAPSIFAVAPSAIIYEVGGTPIQLETIYIGSGSATYSFSTDNASVATVSSTGLVSFVAAGSAIIKVTGNVNGSATEVLVPVLVIGAPTVTLPIAKVTLTPVSTELFKNETQQYVAKAYNSDGVDVTANYSFTWEIKAQDADEPVPATISNTGLVTATTTGDAYITASAGGFHAKAELIVNPDTIIMITPFMVGLGGFDLMTFQPNPDTQSLTAKTYKVDRNAYKTGQANYLSLIANPSNLRWSLPLTGVPMIDQFYDLFTISNNTTVGTDITKKQNAVGSTVLIADSPGSGIAPGISMVTVQ
jgi:hypothetical protein